MANINTLKTRILNKFDTLTNWNAATTFYPREGEICLANLGSQNITNADGTQELQPIIGIKIGLWDGVEGSATQKNFSQLPWTQAIAGDVYAWAKASKKPDYEAKEIVGIDAYIADYVNEQMGISVDTDTQYKIVKVDNYNYKLQSKGKTDSAWKDVADSQIVIPQDTLTTGTANGTVSFNGTDVAVYGLKSAAYTDSTDYATSAQGAKADSAIQKITVLGKEMTEGSTINADEAKTALGLKSAAYEEASAFDAAGSAAAVLGSAADEATANTVYGAKAAAAKAQSDIDAFFSAADKGDAALDTLKEIQDFLNSDTGTVQTLIDDVSENKTAIENIIDGTTKVPSATNADVAAKASGLDASGEAAVKAVKVDNATNADQLGGVAAANYATKTYADQAEADAISSANTYTDQALLGLDSSVTAAAEANNQVSVLTGVTQTDGKLTSHTEVQLAAVAKTGDIKDLTQGSEDFLILNCGNSSTLI